MKYSKIKSKDLEHWIEWMRKQNEEMQEKAKLLKGIEQVALAHFTLDEVKEIVEFVKVILKKKEMKGDFDYLKNVKNEESQ